MPDYEQFFQESLPAQKVKLPGRAVIHRGLTSSAEIRAMEKTGRYVITPGPDRICEFEVNGQVLARGIIIKKRKGHFLKITQLVAIKEEIV